MKTRSTFIWGIIYFCTLDGYFRILVKTSSELICTRLLTVHSCPFIHCTVHRGNNNVRNPFFVLIHDKCRDFRAHLNSCQLPCHSYLLLYNYHLSSLQGHRHEEDRQDCSLTWFYGKERSGNGADALCTQYHNSVFLYSGLFVFGQFEFLCHFWWVKKQKNQNNMPFNAILFAKSTILASSIKISGRQDTSFSFIILLFFSWLYLNWALISWVINIKNVIKTTCLLTHYFLQSQPY